MLDCTEATWKILLYSQQRLENELHKGPTHRFCNICTTSQLPCEYVYNSIAVDMDKIPELVNGVVLEKSKKPFFHLYICIICVLLSLPGGKFSGL